MKSGSMGVWARLFGRFRRGQVEHRSIDLEPLHQTLLLTLLRFGECSFQRLRAECEAVHGANPAQVVRAVVMLQQEGLLQPPASPTGGRQHAQHALTRSGRRVAKFLPPDCHSRISVRL